MNPPDQLCTWYRDSLMELLAERGKREPLQYIRWHYATETLALAGTALMTSVLDRVLNGGPSKAAAFLTAQELQYWASQRPVPPDGRRIAISDAMYQTLISQPTIDEDSAGSPVLGPMPGAVARTVAEGVRRGWLVRPDALMPVLRTIDLHYMFDHQALLGVAASSHQNGGAALLLASRLQPGTFQAEALEGTSEAIRIRARLLAAVWREIWDVAGISVPIVWRGERRQQSVADEGTVTDARAWLLSEQPRWRDELDTIMPSNAICIVELAPDGLRGWTYRHGNWRRPIVRTEAFVSDAELAPTSPGMEFLTIEDADREAEVGAQLMFRLRGELEAPDGRRYAAVFARTRTFWVPFVIPAEQAAAFTKGEWELVRAALAPLHGRTNGVVSDDQGLALRLPYEHGLRVAARDPIRAGNIDSIREITHALAGVNHWLVDPGSPGDSRSLREVS